MVVRWLLLLLVPVSILMVPVPSGLTPLAWKIFAVYMVTALCGWYLQLFLLRRLLLIQGLVDVLLTG